MFESIIRLNPNLYYLVFMIQLPKNIYQQILSFGQNSIVKLCATNDLQLESDKVRIVSNDPFVLEYNGKKIFFTKSASNNIPDDCEYGVLTQKKPTSRAFNNNEIQCLGWIKHPLMHSLEPNEIVSSWKGNFFYKKEEPVPNGEGLRGPQLSALHAFMAEAQNPKERNIIVMPTGTGKTETMLSILVANQCEKVLVTVPSDALRTQLAQKFITLGVLKKFGIVGDACETPRVAILKERIHDLNQWQDLINKSNVIVTTMALISRVEQDVLDLLHSKISHLFVDEAHHSEASTWDTFINGFSNNKVTLFTATPFRNDGKKLQGKYIFKFSLKDAQEQGYYKPITLIAFREYNNNISDQKIAQNAIAKLLEDRANGFDHILMARCATKKRALEVFEYYKEYEDLSPVVVYTGKAGINKTIEEIKNKTHKIIVCVNMLGEGFDLPEMKIAAIHDAKQSLPVTLQFIGRFTRTAHDVQLGNASVVLNIAQKPMELDLIDLYTKDADWNTLLPQINDEATDEQIDFNNFIRDFSHVDESMVPFQSIRPALSTIIYDVSTNEWNPSKWKDVLTADNYDYRFSDINQNGDTIVIILGSISKVDFCSYDGIQDVKWGVVLIHWKITPQYNHLYINSSMSDINPDTLAEAIFNKNVTRITGSKLFRIFSGVTRFSVQNFGGRKSGDISFKSYYGKEVEEGIRLTEARELTKNNIFGIGYRNGEKISIGCSIKGKVWSYIRGNIQMFCKWCETIGRLISDDTISEDIIMNNTLHVNRISAIPQVMPLSIDWDADVYRFSENRYIILKNAESYQLSDFDLEILNDNIYPYIDFSISNDSICGKYRIEYGQDVHGNCFYKVKQLSGDVLTMIEAGRQYNNIVDYFNSNNNAPVIYFADGGILYANNYVKVNKENSPFAAEDLIAFPGNGVDLNKESQDIYPYHQDSIQYYFANKISSQFDILYDDDYSGEIADLIGFQIEDKYIHIHLFHLKYARNGLISNRIDNFYEVCGQAEKCIKWRNRGKEIDLFNHLFKRMTKKLNGQSCSRLIKGTEDMLEQISNDIKWKKELKFHISIVQPSLSKANPSIDILNLLGAVQTYLLDEANVKLSVYCSE